MSKGILHLLPNVLDEQGYASLPSYLGALLAELRVFYVEDLRTARRFLKAMNREIVIDDLSFYLLNEHEQDSLQHAPALFRGGQAVGYLSDAGCPAVADPGQELVRIAHEAGARVQPHVGPNSILLALMASGFNGQQFRFHGYLPNKQPQLGQAIKDLEAESRRTGCTQLFIETPYRNRQLLQELIRNGHPGTRLCIAAGLTGPGEIIKSQTLAQWQNDNTDFHKVPAVFVLFAG